MFNGVNCPVYIIAEIGVNHNGSLQLALESIDRAKQCGANAVKFQTFRTENLVTMTAPKASYQQENSGSNESQFEMLKKLELSFTDFKRIREYCYEKRIDFISTPFDDESAEFLYSIDISAFKVGSGDMNNIPFLYKLDQYKLPIILSTGMSNLEEVNRSLNVIQHSPVVLLHCTSDYPAPLEDVNLLAMKTMEQTFHKNVGYSDHTKGTEVSVAAVALGAKIIEKHFTLDCSLPGPDHKASIDPVDFKRLVDEVRNVELALGDGKKRCMPSEENTKAIARKSIVLIKDKKTGDKIIEADLKMKRPGTGIEPRFYYDVIGKTLKRDVQKDQLLSWDDLE